MILIASEFNNHQQISDPSDNFKLSENILFFPMAALQQALSRSLNTGILRNSGSSLYSSRSLFTKTTTVSRSHIRTGLYTTVFALSTGLFAVYYFDARSAIHRYFFAPLLRYAMDAETGHKVAITVLRSGLGPRDPLPDDSRLKFEVNLRYILPVDFLTILIKLSSGDMRSLILWVWLPGLIKMEKPSMVCFPHIHSLSSVFMRIYGGIFNLGFSWVEIGSVTPRPQVRRRSGG